MGCFAFVYLYWSLQAQGLLFFTFGLGIFHLFNFIFLPESIIKLFMVTRCCLLMPEVAAKLKELQKLESICLGMLLLLFHCA